MTEERGDWEHLLHHYHGREPLTLLIKGIDWRLRRNMAGAQVFDVNALTKAAADADDAALTRLLAIAPPGAINIPNDGYDGRLGYTAIQVLNRNSPSTARILLEHQADPNVRDPNYADPKVERTILHDVSHNGSPETARLLLQHGANPVAQDQRGNTPAHIAAEAGGPSRIEILDALRNVNAQSLNRTNRESLTPREVALQNGNNDIAQWLQTNNP